MAIFGSMKDPRRISKGNLRHDLSDIVFLVVAAVVSGCNDWETIVVFGESQLGWLRKYRPFKHGIPSHDTLNRVFSALDPKVFSEKFIEWTEEVYDFTEGELVAIDGKTMRGSQDVAHDRSALHIVSAYASKNKISLGQVVTDEKSNEITAIPNLLDMIFLKGATVSIDAMGCQKAIAEKIIDQHADYLLAVKNNQKSLYEEIENLFVVTTSQSHTDYHIGHGRGENRKCDVITDLTFLDESKHWKGLKSVIRIESERFLKASSKTEKQTRYYISSHSQKSAKQLNELIRDHWAIENNLHWMLDVNFREDESKRKGNSAANFNVINKVALALIEKCPIKKSKRQRRFKAAFDPSFREKILNL